MMGVIQLSCLRIVSTCSPSVLGCSLLSMHNLGYMLDRLTTPILLEIGFNILCSRDLLEVNIVKVWQELLASAFFPLLLRSLLLRVENLLGR